MVLRLGEGPAIAVNNYAQETKEEVFAEQRLKLLPANFSCAFRLPTLSLQENTNWYVFMKKAEETRKTILQKAFALSYAHGYRPTSIDTIIAEIGVTKGAFYYHFKNKDEMGVAIIEEILKPTFLGGFAKALAAEKNPLEGIYNLMENLLLNDNFLRVECGCPVANLAGEMAPWNGPFTEALRALTEELTHEMAALLERGKAEGFVGRQVAAKQTVLFILSGYWGVRTLGKLEGSPAVYTSYLKGLKQYLDSLR